MHQDQQVVCDLSTIRPWAHHAAYDTGNRLAGSYYIHGDCLDLSLDAPRGRCAGRQLVRNLVSGPPYSCVRPSAHSTADQLRSRSHTKLISPGVNIVGCSASLHPRRNTCVVVKLKHAQTLQPRTESIGKRVVAFNLEPLRPADLQPTVPTSISTRLAEAKASPAKPRHRLH